MTTSSSLYESRRNPLPAVKKLKSTNQKAVPLAHLNGYCWYHYNFGTQTDRECLPPCKFVLKQLRKQKKKKNRQEPIPWTNQHTHLRGNSKGTFHLYLLPMTNRKRKWCGECKHSSYNYQNAILNYSEHIFM